MFSFSRRHNKNPETFDQLSLSGRSRSTNPKVFRDGKAAHPSDVFIALMGMTGSGKSSFISLCCRGAAKVGHELGACTTVVDVYAYERSASRTVYLIDTPGFDDTSRSDAEVLREIAGWLTASYSNKVLLHGIIYLHRITDVRMQGSAKKNLLMFKKLCGNDALQQVVLTTTMWDKVPHREAEDREKQLVNTPEYWGFMVSKGSTVYRHNNTVESAIRIIEQLAHGSCTVTLDIQNQMVNQKQDLSQTAAGRELESEIIKERQKWAAELKDAQEQMKEAIRLRDKESEQVLRELKDDFTTRMQRLERDNERLRIDTERLRNAKLEKLQEAFENQSKAHANALKKLQQENVDLKGASQKTVKVPAPVAEPVSASVSASFMSYMNMGSFFASLYGDNYSLCGPKQTLIWDYCLPPSEMNDFKEMIYPIYFLVCGTERAWVYKHGTADGGTQITHSDNLNVQYPFLCEKLHSWSYAEVSWVCLGPNQTFFAKWKDIYSFWLTPAISSKINQIKGDITAVALGINETYVIVHGNQWSWELKGHYGGLATILKNATSAPRLVALNSHNTNDYLILLGTMGYSLSNSPLGSEDFGDFREWKGTNGV